MNKMYLYVICELSGCYWSVIGILLHYITFYLADAFIQSDIQSSAIQGHITTERQIRYISHRLG